MSTSLSDVGAAASQSLGNDVASANTAAGQLGSINTEIAIGNATGANVNSLLDQRDQILDQLGSRPAQMLGAEGLRNLIAVVEARMDPASPGGVDGDLAGEIARFAFGPAGDDLVDDLKTDGDRVVYAEAVERMPILTRVATLPAPGG